MPKAAVFRPWLGLGHVLCLDGRPTCYFPRRLPSASAHFAPCPAAMRFKTMWGFLISELRLYISDACVAVARTAELCEHI